MLTGNCEVQNFLRLGDHNIRISVVPKQNGRFVQKGLLDSVWREAFRDSLGGGIIHDCKTDYSVVCQLKDVKFDFVSKGNDIIDTCWKYLNDVDIARIELTKTPVYANSKRSWIIMRVEE
jgi:hypothetical protein